MKSLIDSFYTIVTSLTLMDYLFMFLLFLLIIIAVVMVYYLKLGNNDLKQNDFEQKKDDEIIKNEPDANENDIIQLTDFERNQEDGAIISYDELVNKKKPQVNIKTEQMDNKDLKIKKINIELPKKKNLNSNYNDDEAYLEMLIKLNNK